MCAILFYCFVFGVVIKKKNWVKKKKKTKCLWARGTNKQIKREAYVYRIIYLTNRERYNRTNSVRKKKKKEERKKKGL